MKKAIISLYFLFYIFSSNAQSYNVKDFGAIADNQTVNTIAIQKAIDECNVKGGGTVEVPERNRRENNPNAFPIEIKNGKNFASDLNKKMVREINVK